MKSMPTYSLANRALDASNAACLPVRSSIVPPRQRGAGSVEYMLITGFMVAALLTPFSLSQEAESSSALKRLMEAISNQQKAYNYSTQYPSTLNIHDIADSLGDLAPGSGQNGDTESDNTNEDDNSGNGGGGQGDSTDSNEKDDPIDGENNADTGQGESSGEENNVGQEGNGGGDAAENGSGEGENGSGSSSSSGGLDIGISWEGLAATALAICLATPDQNPEWTQDDLDAYEASVNAYKPGWYEKAKGSTGLDNFELNKKTFTDNGITYPFDKEDDSKGFSATLSQTEDGRWILAFRGSELTVDDWLIANPGQALFGKSAQYDAAVELAKEVKKNLGDDVLLAGHSQGGGQAQAASYATGLDAVTFNAAGIRDNFKTTTLGEKYKGRDDIEVAQPDEKVFLEPGNMRNHYVVGEGLTTLQTLPDILLPSANGTQIAHSAPCDKELGRRHMIGIFNPPSCPGKEHREEPCPVE